jgi:NAD(P)-dependent dehydrogenase (short-subunit alcohol dehydrogenase family)
MDLHLDGQFAVIVGGASGIGLAIAREFSRAGCSVAVIDRAAGTNRVADEVALSGKTKCIGLVADVTDYDAVQSAARQCEEDLGRVQHVVYAAGCGSGKFGFPFWNLAPADWDRVLRVNLLGAVHTAHAFAPSLVEQRQGTMLFLSSVAGQIGSQTDPPYSAAKAGLINFAQVAAKDLAPHNVRVNTICPGMVQTPLNRSVWQAWNDRQPPESQQTYDEWGTAKVKQMCPLGRWQTPEEIAALAGRLNAKTQRRKDAEAQRGTRVITLSLRLCVSAPLR